jgi:multidrug efflux pump subunit AcrA (membrane-fusion protein)
VGTIIANQEVKDPNGTITSLLSARLSILQAQQSYDSLISSLPSDLANAQYDLLTAETTLKTDQNTRAAYNEAKCTTDETSYYKSQYEEAQANYNQNSSSSRLKSALDDARSSYYYCISAWPQSDIDKADATIKVDEQTIADLKAKIARLSTGSNSIDVELARDQLIIAKAQLQSQIPVAILKPSDTTVVDSLENINTILGNSNSVVLLDDQNTPLLEVYIDESDLSSAVVGNEVNVSFDSLPDTIFTGHLVYVSPTLTSVSGTNVVEALAQIDSDSYKINQVLPISMSATVDIITAKAENVLLAPVEALRDLGSGKYSVFVVKNGELTLTSVEVGLQDETYAVIKSGLNEGDVVSTGIVETNQ